MRDELKTFHLMGDASSSIYPLAQNAMSEVFNKLLPERRFYQMILNAFNIAPTPMTVELFGKRVPYANPKGLEKRFQDAASAGYFEVDGDGNYTLTAKGMEIVNTSNSTFYSYINKVNQLPADKLNTLTTLLEKLVDGSEKAKVETGGLCLQMTRGGHPTVETGSLAQVDQLLDDLLAFRDDAHISAWMPTGVNGHTWETFSFVCNGEANTVEKFVEHLPFRDYSDEDFKGTLEVLSQKGWIQNGENGYIPTEAGKKIREDVEVATNKIYFAPWSTISDNDLDSLTQILNELMEVNKKVLESNN